jgi:hypothetical protein
MESLEFAQDTTLSGNGIYEVSDGKAPTSVDPDITTVLILVSHRYGSVGCIVRFFPRTSRCIQEQ